MKKSELKEFIKNEILNELSSTTEDTQQDIKDTEELTKAVQDLSKAKEEAGLSEENIGLADLEEMGYEAGVEAFNMHFNLSILNNTPDANSYRKGFIQAIIDNASNRMYEGQEDLNEMAKISGDLKSSIENAMKVNSDLNMTDLKKAIQSDEDVIKALGDSKLYDTQLSKFISAAKGDREVGQRGRKVNPNTIKRPKSPTGKVGRPSKPRDEKEKESKTVASKLSKSVTTSKGDEPTAKDIKQAIGFAKKGKKDLQAQEKRKMVKSFIADMKKEGIISPNGKIEDKAKYDAAWEISKSEIAAAIKKIK